MSAKPPTQQETSAFCFYEDALPEWGIAHLILAEDDQGDVWYPVRPLIEALDIQRTTQTSMLQTDARTRNGVREIHAPTRGGKQRALYVRKRECAIWLTLIDPENVAGRARGRLEDFQAALWQLAQKLVFRRKRSTEAGIEGPTSVAQFGGTQHTDTTCPICDGALHAELERGQLRLTPK